MSAMDERVVAERERSERCVDVNTTISRRRNTQLCAARRARRVARTISQKMTRPVRARKQRGGIWDDASGGDRRRRARGNGRGASREVASRAGRRARRGVMPREVGGVEVAPEETLHDFATGSVCDWCAERCEGNDELNALSCTFAECPASAAVYHQDCLEKYLKTIKLEKCARAIAVPVATRRRRRPRRASRRRLSQFASPPRPRGSRAPPSPRVSDVPPPAHPRARVRRSRKTGFRCPRGCSKASEYDRPCPGKVRVVVVDRPSEEPTATQREADGGFYRFSSSRRPPVRSSFRSLVVYRSETLRRCLNRTRYTRATRRRKNDARRRLPRWRRPRRCRDTARRRKRRARRRRRENGKRKRRPRRARARRS